MQSQSKFQLFLVCFFFGRNLKVDPKPIQNYKENQCNIEKENKIRRLKLLDIKIYSKTIVTKTVWDELKRQNWIESIQDPHK